MLTVAEALAFLLEERAAALNGLAVGLRQYRATEVLPAHRVLAMAGHLLAMLADVERTAHELARFLPDVREF